MVDERTAREISQALRQVLQAGREMQASLAHRLGLRVTDVQATDHIAGSAEPLGTVELGDRLGIRSASAAVLVDRLVEAGHVQRHPDPHDRRRVVLAPTAACRTEVRAHLDPMLEALHTLAAELPEDQAQAVLGYLQQAAQAMHDYANPTRPHESSS